jgi:hypothetical protein
MRIWHDREASRGGRRVEAMAASDGSRKIYVTERLLEWVFSGIQLQDLPKDNSLDAKVATEFATDARVVVTLRTKRRISFKRLQHIVSVLHGKQVNARIADCIAPAPETRLSNRADAFVGAWWGYYLNYDRESHRNIVCWCEERIQLDVMSSLAGHQDASILRFEGKSLNHLGETYKLFAHRLGDSCFAMAAHGKPRAFHALFTRYVDTTENFMIGIWCSISPRLRPAVYLTVMSRKQLELADLKRLTKDYTIEVWRKPSNFDDSIFREMKEELRHVDLGAEEPLKNVVQSMMDKVIPAKSAKTSLVAESEI